MRHAWRVLIGEHTHYCPACKHRWGNRLTSGALLRRAFVRLTFPCVFLLLVLILGFNIGDPKRWIKEQVVVYYRWRYGPGPEHQIQMHKDLGFLYGYNLDRQVEDYRAHRDDLDPE